MKFSIIIPIYNDPRIVACVRSLTELNYDKNEYEIIIVDNNSSTNIQELLRGIEYRYILETAAGSYNARNAGITAASGEWLAFTDSDCVVDKEWLSTIEHYLAKDDVSGVMGYSAGNNANAVAAYEQKMYEENIAGFTDAQELRRIDTRNFAVKRPVIETIGGFTKDIKYGGDMEYGAMAHEAGFTMVYAPDVIVTHTNPTHLPTLLAKRVRQNAGNMLLLTHHTDVFIQEYFPHLLRYKPSTATWLRWVVLWPIIKLHFPFSGIFITLLPQRIGYFYFKAMNVLAMRFGQLNYFIHKQ